MSCRRARRELLWLVRFGPFDAGSAPHLDHLAGCRACRDEVGLDRALVRQLRSALAARVAEASPSPSAWEGVLDRMRQPEPRLARIRTWPMRLAAGLRAGTAMAGASLALVLALNLEVVPIAPAQPDETRPAAVAPAWAGEIPPFVEVAPAAQQQATVAAAERAAPTVAVRQLPPAEQLPLPRQSIAAAGASQAADGTDADAAEPADEWRILVRLVPSDAAGIAPITESTSQEGGDTTPEAAPAPELAPAGAPS